MDSPSGPGDTTSCANVTETALTTLLLSVDEALQDVQQTLDYERSYLRESTIDLTVQTMCFGLFTVLAAVAAYILFSRDSKRRATYLMFIAILILWTSTAAYWIVTLIVTARVFQELHDLTSQSFRGVASVQACLVMSWTSKNATFNCRLIGPNTLAFFNEMYWIRDYTETVTLTIGVVVSDAIVWWRAWVLWPHNRVVRGLCIVLILLTIVTGIFACIPTQAAIGPTAPLNRVKLTLSGDIWGIFTSLLSVLTNFTATALIAYRAWQHRRSIVMYLKQAPRLTQVERTLALLIESGILYCTLWVIISVYAVSDVFPNMKLVTFGEGFTYVLRGCLGTLIGMYPTLIIIICAVDKSLHERSARDEAPQTSIRFNAPPPSRRHWTLTRFASPVSGRATLEAPERRLDALEDVEGDT